MEEIEKKHISQLEEGSDAYLLFEAAKPLMKLLNENYHPHCAIIVTQTNTQVFEGLCSTGYTDEFIKD